MAWSPPRRTVAAAPLVNAATGLITGQTPIYKFGYNLDVDTAEEDLWSGGGTYTGFITTAGTASIVSGSSDDDGDPAGTGAHGVTLFGLDSNFNRATETITLNGITPVVTTTEWIRIDRMFITAAGSGGTNAGLITATVSSAVCARIEIGEGQTQMLVFAIPANHRLVFERVTFEIASTKTVAARLKVRTGLDTSTPAQRQLGEFTGLSDVTSLPFSFAGFVDGPADIWISVRDGTNSEVSAQGIGMLVDLDTV